jgi:rsbT co-antagonist protein RsbR
MFDTDGRSEAYAMALVGASVDAFFKFCPEMFFVTASDGTFLRWSETLREKLGPSIDLDTRFADLVHADDRDTTTRDWEHIQATGEATRFDVRLRDAAGAYVSVSCHARKDPAENTIHGHLREASAPVADVGRRASLKERLLDALAQHMPVCLWAIDAEGRFVYHDGAGLASAGLKPGQFLGMNLFELYTGTDGLGAVKRACAGELVHFYSSAHDVDWENWLIPIDDPEDASSPVVLGLTLDVSSMTRAQTELQAKLDEISKQQEVIRTLSTPIIDVWEGVLALPMVGLVDSSRTAEVMETLLQRIVDTQARFAILDLTGVDVVDTLVANNLIKLVSAIQLLGTEGIVSGLKPNVAQTIVTLGVDLSKIATTRNLRAALALCIGRMEGPRQKR